MRKKLKNTSGLTMIEMLCATSILSLLVLMMSTGIQMALASYRSLTGEAELQLLLNSLTDALSDKLRYCVVTVDDGNAYKGCSIGVPEVDGTTNRVTISGKDLLPAGAYGEADASGKRRYQVESLVFTRDLSKPTPVFEITLTAKDAQSGISKETSLAVRCLNPVKKEGTSP